MRELFNRITYSEFLGYQLYLQREDLKDRKNELYLAQIAAELRRARVKEPQLVKTEHFLFGTEKPEKSEGSKHIWAAHLGIDLNKKKHKPVKDMRRPKPLRDSKG